MKFNFVPYNPVSLRKKFILKNNKEKRDYAKAEYIKMSFKYSLFFVILRNELFPQLRGE